MSAPVIIPTAGLTTADPRWEPMLEWLTANRFDIDQVPIDARIEIRDGTCLGIELYERDALGRLRFDHLSDRPVRRTEWHPLVEQPPAILLPGTGQP